MLLVANLKGLLWLGYMQGGIGMLQLEIHDKKSAGVKDESRIRAEQPSSAGAPDLLGAASAPPGSSGWNAVVLRR